jgi:hypothetical protein
LPFTLKSYSREEDITSILLNLFKGKIVIKKLISAFSVGALALTMISCSSNSPVSVSQPETSESATAVTPGGNSVVIQFYGKTFFIARDASGKVYKKVRDIRGYWEPTWTPIGTSCSQSSNITYASVRTNLYVAYKNTLNRITCLKFDNNTGIWSSLAMGAQTYTGNEIKAISTDGGDATVFFLATNGSTLLMQKNVTGTIYNLGSMYYERIGTCLASAGNYEIAASKVGGTIQHRSVSLGSGTPSFGVWRDIPGTTRFETGSDIVIGKNLDGRFQIFTSYNGGMMSACQEYVGDPNWSAFYTMFTGVSNEIAVGYNSDGRMELFYKNDNGAIRNPLMNAWQTTPNGQWSAPQQLGTILVGGDITVSKLENSDKSIVFLVRESMSNRLTYGYQVPGPAFWYTFAVPLN